MSAVNVKHYVGIEIRMLGGISNPFKVNFVLGFDSIETILNNNWEQN